jgi:hypothetical protein
MGLLALDGSTTLFVTGAMLIVLVMMRRSQKRTTLSKLPPVSPPMRPQQTAAGHHLDAPAAMNRWEVEMHELARDLAGQLDTKIAIVERLVEDAEGAALRLEAVLDRAAQIGLWQRNSGRDDEERAAHEEALAQHGALENLGDTETNHRKPAVDWPGERERELLQAAAPDRHSHAEPANVARDERSQRVYRLADRGLSSAAIADELGLPLGEIELILSVRGTQRT